MSLKDKLAVRPVVKPRFEQLIEELPEEERAALDAACRDSAWSNAAIIRILADEGIPVSKDTFGPYRRRVCHESRG